MAPHSSTLAWKIPWAEERGRLQSMGSLRVGLSNFTFTFHFHALEKAMATHSSIFAWRILGTGQPGGLPSLGSRRVRHDWSNLAAAAAAAAVDVSDALPRVLTLLRGEAPMSVDTAKIIRGQHFSAENFFSGLECILHAAAAKSLQLCPTLCNPIDGSPPGSPIHGIFQARVLKWGAIAFSGILPEAPGNWTNREHRFMVLSMFTLGPMPFEGEGGANACRQGPLWPCGWLRTLCNCIAGFKSWPRHLRSTCPWIGYLTSMLFFHLWNGNHAYLISY